MSRQWLSLVDKSVTFSRFAEVLKGHFKQNFREDEKIEGIYGFLNLKEPESFDKHVYTTANVKLTINSVRAS